MAAAGDFSPRFSGNFIAQFLLFSAVNEAILGHRDALCLLPPPLLLFLTPLTSPEEYLRNSIICFSSEIPWKPEEGSQSSQEGGREGGRLFSELRERFVNSISTAARQCSGLWVIFATRDPFCQWSSNRTTPRKGGIVYSWVNQLHGRENRRTVRENPDTDKKKKLLQNKSLIEPLTFISRLQKIYWWSLWQQRRRMDSTASCGRPESSTTTWR